MSNYKQESLAAESYQRAYRVILENKLGDRPHAVFHEQQVITLGDMRIEREQGQIAVYFEADGAFDVIDPETDQPTGQTATHAQLYALMYSLYRSAADGRDAQAAQPQPEEPAA